MDIIRLLFGMLKVERNINSSVQCDGIADEDCALGNHETKNVVCCARHGLTIPCSTCVEMEKRVKQALEEAQKAKP